MTTSFSADVGSVRTQGAVTSREVDYARTRIAQVLRYARDPILSVRIRLTRLADPALPRPAVAQVNLDLNGRFVRAQAARPTMREAVDEVRDRIHDRLRRAAADWEAIRGGRPTRQPHEWRRTSAPTDRPPYYPRPVEKREVIRHKTFSLARMTIDEAAFDMDMLDYEFHVFAEDGSGVDSILYRAGDTGYRLAQVRPDPDQVSFGLTPATVSTQPAPPLTVDEAAERLTVAGWPFVFFRDTTSGRGCVLYHRYDGHYGLITAAD